MLWARRVLELVAVGLILLLPVGSAGEAEQGCRCSVGTPWSTP